MNTRRDDDVKLTRDERMALYRLRALRGVYRCECTPAIRVAISNLATRGCVKLSAKPGQPWRFAEITDAGRALVAR